MSNTTLSPRLRHLLIQEDRRTGKLVMPGATGPRSPTIVSPSLPPTAGSAPSLLDSTSMTKSRDGRMLPPPRITIDRRGSQSIFSVLNDLRVVSPPLSSSPVTPNSARLHPSPPVLHPRTPPSAPLPSSYQPPYFPHDHRNSISGPLSPGPDLFRGHSSHPYEYHPPCRPVPYGSNLDFLPAFGSRAPISRTTKACNGCRSRKVRCDTGGPEATASGEPSICSRCREAGMDCVYSGAQKRRGPCPG